MSELGVSLKRKIEEHFDTIAEYINLAELKLYLIEGHLLKEEALMLDFPVFTRAASRREFLREILSVSGDTAKYTSFYYCLKKSVGQDIKQHCQHGLLHCEMVECNKAADVQGSTLECNNLSQYVHLGHKYILSLLEESDEYADQDAIRKSKVYHDLIISHISTVKCSVHPLSLYPIMLQKELLTEREFFELKKLS